MTTNFWKMIAGTSGYPRNVHFKYESWDSPNVLAAKAIPNLCVASLLQRVAFHRRKVNMTIFTGGQRGSHYITTD